MLRQRISEIDNSRTGYTIGESELQIIDQVRKGLGNLSTNKELSIIAEELRLLSDKVSTLFGLNVSEDSLNYIFHKMCIGK
jgi:tRNA U34 5-carboxymethylaminomethyl modifying GTPase MnmE/TrmE